MAAPYSVPLLQRGFLKGSASRRPDVAAGNCGCAASPRPAPPAPPSRTAELGHTTFGRFVVSFPSREQGGRSKNCVRLERGEASSVVAGETGEPITWAVRCDRRTRAAGKSVQWTAGTAFGEGTASSWVPPTRHGPELRRKKGSLPGVGGLPTFVPAGAIRLSAQF